MKAAEVTRDTVLSIPDAVADTPSTDMPLVVVSSGTHGIAAPTKA
jgi:hypothetical protein